MKKRLFVIAAGGTGARVVRALLMLMAAGEFRDREVIPLLTDGDIQNGDVQRTLSTLGQYNAVHSAWSSASVGYKQGLFAADTNYANNINANWLSLDLPLNSTLADLTDYDLLLQNNPVKHLIHSMYGEDTGNIRASLVLNRFKANLFKVGCRHVLDGGMQIPSVLSQMLNQNPNTDEVVIVGSTFGGIGPVAICEFLKLIKRISHIRTAVVMVEPYFRLDNPAFHTQPDIFIEKTKSFLDFFNKNHFSSMADVIYMLGTQELSTIPYTGPGGPDQINNAHIVELMSALAVKDFTENSDAFGVRTLPVQQNDCYRFTIDDLLIDNCFESARALCSLAATSYWLLNKEYKNISRFSSLRKLFRSTDSIINNCISDLTQFARLFVEWCDEMSFVANESNRACLFDFKANTMDDLVVNHTVRNQNFFVELFCEESSISRMYRESILKSFSEGGFDKQKPSSDVLLQLLNTAGITVTDNILNQ